MEHGPVHGGFGHLRLAGFQQARQLFLSHGVAAAHSREFMCEGQLYINLRLFRLGQLKEISGTAELPSRFL